MSKQPPAFVYAADKRAKMDFTYKGEGRNDRWRSFADDALAGRKWAGDCDDLASTALDLLTRQDPGIPLDRLFRLCVASPECPPGVPYDHMVAGYIDPLAGLVIFGDTFTHAHAVSRSPHKIKRYSRLSEGVTWREGSPA